MSSGYSIGKAAQLAGLTPFVIRAWENRYRVVEPGRNEGGQRRYSDSDIERLRTLAQLVDKGCRIGEIVSLTDAALAELSSGEDYRVRTDIVDTALGVTESFDAPGLQAVLENALGELGPVGLADRVIFPFMEEVGRSWHEKKLKVMHEHLASTVVTGLLGRILMSYRPAADAPRAVAAAPPGQEHNIGAACCAVAAADAGWNVSYLGSHLPAGEIVDAVIKSNAVLLLLSIVFPAKASAVKEALEILENGLPEGVELIVGGTSAGSFVSGTAGRAEKAPRSIGALRTILSLS